MRTARIAFTLLACLAMANGLAAQPSNKKTKVTFSGPFEIPNPHTKSGVMTLPAGSYIFTLVDTAADRHIVRVTDMNGKVMSTILAIGDYRLNASSKTVMYFSESAAGSPVALKSWFYPGDNYGERFVYPKVKAVALAAETKEPVPALPAEVKVIEPKAVAIPLTIVTPAKEETPYTPQAFAATDAKDTAGVEGEPVQVAQATPLPKTASPIYAAGLVGLLLFAAGLTLRRISVHLR